MDPVILKFTDKLLGKLLCSLLPRATQKEINYQRILIIRPGGIGDAVLLLPTIAALAKFVPNAAIDLLAERRNYEVFTWCTVVKRTWCYDHLPELLGVLSNNYDIVINTEQWYRLSAVVARLTRAPRIIGFAGNGRERLLTDAVPYDLGSHETDSFLSLLGPLGCGPDVAESGYPIVLPPGAKDRAGELMVPLAGRPFIAIFPGASVPEKIWPIDRFRVIAQDITARGFVPVVVGGRGECASGELIIAGLGGLNLAGRTTLSEAAAVVARATALITGDSGLLHIASALNTPTVALFGPSDWRKWGARGESSKIISAACPCSPCSSYGTIPLCPDHQCMNIITIEQVITAIGKLLRTP